MEQLICLLLSPVVLVLLTVTSAPNTLAIPTRATTLEPSTSTTEANRPFAADSEACPPDSRFFEGVCKCDPDSCTKPPCPHKLQVVAVGDEGTPGRCCSRYECTGCRKEEMIGDRCPCAVGAVIGEGGRCECVDRHKSVDEGGVCVCDESKCELPALCDGKSVGVRELEGCCHTTRCIECPEDSYPTSYNDDLVEDKCTCFPCSQETQCGANQTAVVIRRGIGFPGKCCNLYSCAPSATLKCTVNETVYSEGDTWKSASGARCKCQNGISLCYEPDHDPHPEASCLTPDGKVYHHMETWVEDLDNCTNCTCIDGQPKCISHMCLVNVSQIKFPNCPPLTDCDKTCPGGFKLNKRGCQTCRCNFASADPLDELLRQFNMTRLDLLELLNGNRPTTTTTTTTTEDPVRHLLKHFDVGVDDLREMLLKRRHNDDDESFPTTVNLLVMVFSALIGIALTAAACFFYQICKNNKNSIAMISYKYKPVKKEKNENNNIAKISA